MSNHHPIKSIAKGLLLFVLLVVAVLFCFFYFFQKAFCLDLGDGVKLEVVKTPDNIWWGKYEVTQEQWMAIIRRRPSGCERQMGPDKPVLLARDSEIDEFLNKLNALPSVKMRGLVFRLPTRGEWETACLAGSRGMWPLVAGGREGTLDELAWYDGEWDESHPVGMKTPNAYGLYDMLGNVSERTTTKAFAPSYFPELPPELENWYAGGDMSFERADFLAGGRTGIARNYAYSFAGFRICAPARGYSAPMEETVVQEDRSTGAVDSVALDDTPKKISPPVPLPPPQPASPSALRNRPPGTLDSQGETGKTAERPTKPHTAREDWVEGPRVEHHPTVVPPPVPMSPAKMTPESIMELAKKQASQKVAEGDWEGAQKILENVRAMAESLEASPKKVEEARLAVEAEKNAGQEKENAQKARAKALDARIQADTELFGKGIEDTDLGIRMTRWEDWKGLDLQIQEEETNLKACSDVEIIMTDAIPRCCMLVIYRELLKPGFDCYQEGLRELEEGERGFFDGDSQLAESHWMAAATAFTQAVDIMKQRVDTIDADNLMRQMAAQNNDWAQLFLGMACIRNHDYSEGVRWIRKAAEQGNAVCQFLLGMCYLDGRGVEENILVAGTWFRKAAAQGLVVAQDMLGKR